MTPERPKVMTLREAAREVAQFYSLNDGTPLYYAIKNLRSALADDEELHDEIVAVLRDVGTEWLRDRPIVACRQCDGEGRKIAAIIHEPDCRLAAILHRLEPSNAK